MPEEPIDIIPGVYTIPGKQEVVGLCIMIDDQDGKWEVTASDHYTTTIKIKKGAHWNVQEYTDPKTGKRKVQIFREGAKLNSLALKHFIHRIDEVCTPNGHAANNEWPELRVFYTIPEDSNTPPFKIKAP